MTRHEVRQTIQPWIDMIELKSANTGEYYAINHVTPQQLCALEDVMVDWLKKIGIKFEV